MICSLDYTNMHDFCLKLNLLLILISSLSWRCLFYRMRVSVMCLFVASLFLMEPCNFICTCWTQMCVRRLNVFYFVWYCFALLKFVLLCFPYFSSFTILKWASSTSRGVRVSANRYFCLLLQKLNASIERNDIEKYAQVHVSKVEKKKTNKLQNWSRAKSEYAARTN